MQLTFHGAAREVTGSCHVVRVNEKTILLDGGLFQGRRSEVRGKNTMLPCDPGAIDVIVLSHAHIDHAGRLPYFVRCGYQGPIVTTHATKGLCEVMLADSAHIQEKDTEFLARRRKEYHEPLYGIRDVDASLGIMRGLDYGEWHEVVPGVRCQLIEAGHILGSASVILEWNKGSAVRRLAFSGDIGRAGLSIIRDPTPPTDVDAVIMESTYGNREHAGIDDTRNRLAVVVTETAARGGKILIPAFAVGRTQELLYTLHGLAQSGLIPRIPVVLDSPLAIRATKVFAQHAALFDSAEPLVRAFLSKPERSLNGGLVEFAETPEQSKEAMRRNGPAVVVAASGMAESGRILHHLMHGASDPRNTIMIVGFQAEHTLGRRIVERRQTIKVFGDEIELRAQVEILNGYSAHADRSGLLRWHEAVRQTSPRLKQTWLVHGEPAAQDALAADLALDGVKVECPHLGSTANV